MTRIVLVHGAWHDSSCWGPLVDELSRRGHDAVAVDLPSETPGLGSEAYAEAVEEALAEAEAAVREGAGREEAGREEAGREQATDDRVVLVGHSLGGLTVPVVAQRLGPRRVAAMVLVAALLPRPGSSFDGRAREEPGVMARGFGRGQDVHDDRTTSWSAAAGAAELYRGVAEESSAEVVAEAVRGLRRQAWTVGREVTPLTAWPDVPTTVVVCAGDQVVDPDRARRDAGDIAGADVVELPGGHFPMLTRPAELAAVLDTVIAQVAGPA